MHRDQGDVTLASTIPREFGSVLCSFHRGFGAINSDQHFHDICPLKRIHCYEAHAVFTVRFATEERFASNLLVCDAVRGIYKDGGMVSSAQSEGWTVMSYESCIADQIIELTCQSWLDEKTLFCAVGENFSDDKFINHSPTKAVDQRHSLIARMPYAPLK
jgi:hypothetical protein